MLMPGDGRRKANWKATQGPKTSIASAPRPMIKATGILPWAGGTSLVVGTTDRGGGCWPNANPGKDMKTIKRIDHLFSFLCIGAVLLPHSHESHSCAP